MRSNQPSPNLRMPGWGLAERFPDEVAAMDVEHSNPFHDAALKRARAENRKGNCHET